MVSLLWPLTTSGGSAISPSSMFVKNRDHRFGRGVVSCGSDPNSDSSASNIPETSIGKLDRRNVLLGIGGLYGAGATDPSLLAFGNPVPAPDINRCGTAVLPDGVKPVNCCPPPSKKIIDFKLPSRWSPMRVRPAAHLVNEEYIAKYRKAVERMKALRDDDPRSFKQQANVHCAYCQQAYKDTDPELQVHDSWLFFPFHRYYLYFYERILGSLIDDPTFALPYWSWDTPKGMEMPDMYVEQSQSSLYDRKRNPDHFPHVPVNHNFSFSNPNPPSDVIYQNLANMYKQVVSGAKQPELFFGSKYSSKEPSSTRGTIENSPHNPIHIWSGLFENPHEDLGNFYTAGRDPMFYSHHANVDRMWVLWKTKIGGRKRKDIKDPDWLNSSFAFYDEKARLVRVKVRDCLDPFKLRYKYEEIRIPWLDFRARPKLKKKTGMAKLPRSTLGDFPKPLDSVISVEVPRPKKSRGKEEKEEEEEVLLITGIQVDRGAFTKFDVYINDEEDYEASNLGNTEFAGSFVNVPHSHESMERMMKTTRLRLGITDLLEDLGADDDDSIIVTIVPRDGKATIGGVEIEFVSG